MLHKTIVTGINVILLYYFKRRILLKTNNTAQLKHNIPFLNYSQFWLTYVLQSFQL